MQSVHEHSIPVQCITSMYRKDLTIHHIMIVCAYTLAHEQLALYNEKFYIIFDVYCM